MHWCNFRTTAVVTCTSRDAISYTCSLTQITSYPPPCILLLVFCFSVIFVCVCYTRNVIINVTSIGRQISELMFLWWPAILYSVLKSVCLLMANKWMMRSRNSKIMMQTTLANNGRKIYHVLFFNEKLHAGVLVYRSREQTCEYQH